MTWWEIGLVGVLVAGLTLVFSWLLLRAWRALGSEMNDLGRVRNTLAKASVIAIGTAYVSLAVPVLAGALLRVLGVSSPVQLGKFLWHGLPLIWLGLTGAAFGLCASGLIRIGLVAGAGSLVILGLGIAAMR